MRIFKNIILLILFGLIFTACSTKEYTKQQSVFIVFKTPVFKHADLGFIYENSDELKVEIYSSGTSVLSLDIMEEDVCLSLMQCMSKKRFNKEVLSAYYPDDMIEDIFRGKEVFGGKNMIKTRNSFTQQIVKQDKYDIHYSVFNNQIIFRDTINEILIKIKRVER